MRFKEKIYNKYSSNFRTSSDICEFKYPTYAVTGMGLIEPGLTFDSENVYVLDDDVDLPIELTFLTNLEQLNDNVRFNYYVLRYDKETGVFSNIGVYVSDIFDYLGENHESVLNTLELLGEGEYIFKVGYQYGVCTEFADMLGKQQTTSTFNSSLPYGNWDVNNDKYFVMLYTADEPLLDIGIGEGGLGEDGGVINQTDKIRIDSLSVENGVSSYIINIEPKSDVIISWNGSILSKNDDYTLVGKLLTFNEPLHMDDLVNLIYIGKSTNSGLKIKNIIVVGPIPQGITGGEGSNNVYFNTETNRHELYTDSKITNDDSFIVMLNGATLANRIDYYVSTSNKKRVILNGEIRHDDAITIIYDSGENLVRGITDDYIDVVWYVTKNIVDDDGSFEVELALDKEFTQIENVEVVPYVLGQVNYSKRVELNYEYGQILYYRIKNIKNYTTISGDELNTENYSEYIQIEIKTNISNNY